MLAGGVHSMIHPFGMTGFILLTAMSTRNDDPARASRPFDRDRDGFVIGEGGGMLVLEALEHARARGATIYGEVAGHASTADAFRLTDSHDEGRGAVAAMRLALEDAGSIPRTSITSTPTARAPRSTTRSRPWRSSASSAKPPARSRSRAPRA